MKEEKNVKEKKIIMERDMGVRQKGLLYTANHN